MATHGLIIVAMKTDNELSISVLLYFKSVKKWKFVLRKTKQNKMIPPPQKKKTVRKCFLWRESNPWPLTCKVNTLSIMPNS